MKNNPIKEIVFVLILVLLSSLILGCSENATEEKIIPYESEVIQYDIYPQDFLKNGINYNDLLGEWKLTNAKFECALGEFEHFEDNFAIEESDKRMVFGEGEISKICFWNSPKFVGGVYETIKQDSVKEFYWKAAYGAPTFFVDVNYTNEVLTLYYRTSEVLINEKYYEGNVFESYTK